MIARAVAQLVGLCIRFAWQTIAIGTLLVIGSAFYIGTHFSIHADVNELIAANLPWKQRAASYAKDFPDRGIVVVLDAPTAELADDAADKLTAALRSQQRFFTAVSAPQGGSFFAQNGLLYLPTEEVARLTRGLANSKPFLGVLASDPSLRGVLGSLAAGLSGVEQEQLKLEDLSRPMNMASDTLANVLAGQPASFSWRTLASGKTPSAADLRRFIEIEPVLNYDKLEPGRAASDAIRKTASDLRLAEDDHVQLHMTGQVVINDSEFATIKNSLWDNLIGLAAVVVILFLALRSGRLMLAVFISVGVGLALSTALGLLLVGALNVISVAFFALFTGLSVDFAIQFSVRYRAERWKDADLHAALRNAALAVGKPLALAAAATALGFASFLPTSYRGLSELGEIAGAGMIVAFIVSVTLLPALLSVLNPPGEAHSVGFTFLAPLDAFLLRHRMKIVVGTIAVVALVSPVLAFLPFDLDPLHLRSSSADSVATYLKLQKDPEIGANAIDVEAPDLGRADALAKRIASLPEVAQVKTLSGFIPGDEDQKIELIRKAASALGPVLNPAEAKPKPSDQDDIYALTATVGRLNAIAGEGADGAAAAAHRLSGLLATLAKSDAAARERVRSAFVVPLDLALAQLREELKPRRVTIASLPSDISRAWQTPDGRARIEVLPKGDAENTQTLRAFARAVLTIAPQATGPGIILYESANTVLSAFLEAGLLAFAAIAILLWIVLRRLSDVVLTLVPLMVAALVTLELCSIFRMPLNFANIIALPLLLGVGVAFKIYYVEAWRSGKTNLMQSSLTRAIFFSALTTATAFGSLWLSPDPGMSSMGKLMALALVSTLRRQFSFSRL